MVLLGQLSFDYKVACDACPLRDCSIFRPLAESEIQHIGNFKIGELRVGPHSTVLAQGVPSDHLFTLLEGWAFRYKTLEDGRRQIVNFVLPGNFLGLQATLQSEMDHSVETLTAAAFCVFPRAKLLEFFAKSASLAYDLTWLAAREEQVLDEHLLSLGRRTAMERAAYYLMHLYVRATDVELAIDGKVRFPFTQQHLADALGLSLVHTNKILRSLINRGLIEWEQGWFKTPDLAALANLAQYDLERARMRPLI